MSADSEPLAVPAVRTSSWSTNTPASTASPGCSGPLFRACTCLGLCKVEEQGFRHPGTKPRGGPNLPRSKTASHTLKMPREQANAVSKPFAEYKNCVEKQSDALLNTALGAFLNPLRRWDPLRQCRAGDVLHHHVGSRAAARLRRAEAQQPRHLRPRFVKLRLNRPKNKA